jgi:hypothetical protein
MTASARSPVVETAAPEAAERMRRACVEAALEAWEDAGVRGLCAEGRFEAAIDAMRRLALPLEQE